MIDQTPFIIVDNQKLSPIERLPGLNPATGCRRERDEQPFGIVDRVTLSLEAREKSRHQQVLAKAKPPALNTMGGKPQTSTHALLTYSALQGNN